MTRIASVDLIALAQRALAASGANPDMALKTAIALVDADALGLASHGVARVPTYAAHLRNGRADAVLGGAHVGFRVAGRDHGVGGRGTGERTLQKCGIARVAQGGVDHVIGLFQEGYEPPHIVDASGREMTFAKPSFSHF